MSEASKLIACVKRLLRQQGMTYKDVAQALDLSEANVKRLFALQRFSLERLIAVAQLLGLSLTELTQEAALSDIRLHTLSETQERQLLADPKLLLVAVCVLNHWPVADIAQRYALSEAETIRRLVKLDSLGLINLLPNNRVRLNIARDFAWLPNGPITQYFRSNGLPSFVDSRFDGDDEVFVFSHAMLSAAAIAQIKADIEKLRARVAELHEASRSLPLAKRQGVGVLLALRPWEPSAFATLRRPTGGKA